MASLITTVLAALALSVAYLRPVAAQSTFEQRCASFGSKIQLEGVQVHFTEHVPAGTTLFFPDNDPTCLRPNQTVSAEVCRVAMYVATSNRSGITMESWLPSNWTGRFLSTGNGGISGCLQYEDVDYASGLGFAAVGANGGHNGSTGVPFLNNLDVIADYSWRSIHTETVVGKALTSLFYGKNYTKSYYLGCSTGGRQGFKAAQANSSDFDGFVVGAPALAFDNLTSWSGTFYQTLQRQGPNGYPPNTTWAALDANLLAQCDAIDGVADGIIEDPLLCNYRPEDMICSGSSDTNPNWNDSSCITATQASTLRQVFSAVYGEDGSLVFPALQVGTGLIEAVYYIYAAEPFLYTRDWYKYAIYNNASFSVSDFGPENWAYAWNLNPADVNTWNGDLSHVRDRGSKILHYHGQDDQIITSSNSPRYYDYVSQTMDLSSNDLDDFYRFFRISGMQHCMGGPGATFIGNLVASSASLDPDQNVLMAMVRWVEKGIAPETITGTAYVNQTKRLGVDFKRAHCRYPYRNVYQGKGDYKQPESWKCVL